LLARLWIDQRDAVAEIYKHLLAGAMVLAQDDGELLLKASIQIDD
jgi:hypothetical protein